MVFTQGDLDPWMPAGVPPTTSSPSSSSTSQEQQAEGSQYQLERSVVSVVIEQGGHHLDLFWPTNEDPQNVR